VGYLLISFAILVGHVESHGRVGLNAKCLEKGWILC